MQVEPDVSFLSIDEASLETLQSNLDASLKDGVWLCILEVLQVVGIADQLQLLQMAGLTRDRLKRALDKMDAACAGNARIFRQLAETLPRTGQRGRAPAVYILEENGAALLRRNGHPDTQPCKLADKRSRIHALAILDVYIAAKRAGQSVLVDRVIYDGNERLIRPDLLVNLPDGHKLILEVEQEANFDILPRISESLRNKKDFFASQVSQGYLPEARILFNLPADPNWRSTLNVWQQAAQSVAQEVGPLGCRLLAMPLSTFLAQPEWEMESSKRWREIQSEEVSDDYDAEWAGKPKISNVLSGSLDDDIAILRALAQYFEDERLDQTFPQPDRNLFFLLYVIYAGSHTNGRVDVSMPYASMYLLKEYLDIHYDLRKKLQQAMHRGRGSLRWNTSGILHRMQVVADTFLAYHGWRNYGLLFARAEATDMNSDHTRAGFHIAVSIQNTNLILGLPIRKELTPEQAQIGDALEWVLNAFFIHAEYLGLGAPEFW